MENINNKLVKICKQLGIEISLKNGSKRLSKEEKKTRLIRKSIVIGLVVVIVAAVVVAATNIHKGNDEDNAKALEQYLNNRPGIEEVAKENVEEKLILEEDEVEYEPCDIKVLDNLIIRAEPTPDAKALFKIAPGQNHAKLVDVVKGTNGIEYAIIEYKTEDQSYNRYGFCRLVFVEPLSDKLFAYARSADGYFMFTASDVYLRDEPKIAKRNNIATAQPGKYAKIWAQTKDESGHIWTLIGSCEKNDVVFSWFRDINERGTYVSEEEIHKQAALIVSYATITSYTPFLRDDGTAIYGLNVGTVLRVGALVGDKYICMDDLGNTGYVPASCVSISQKAQGYPEGLKFFGIAKGPQFDEQTKGTR